MQYVVHEVEADEIEGLSHIIVKQPEGPPLLFVSGEVARCWRTMRRWEDTWEPCDVPSVTIPAQYAERMLRAV